MSATLKDLMNRQAEPKRRRGRPKGSKNKPTLTVVPKPTTDSDNSPTPKVELVSEAERPVRLSRYWCRRPFDYAGYSYERGETIRMGGFRNDEKLIRLGFVAEFKVEPRYECGVCGKKFTEEIMRDEHGRAKHRRRFEDDIFAPSGPLDLNGQPNMFVDVEGDKEEERLQVVAPLYLDKTEASRSEA